MPLFDAHSHLHFPEFAGLGADLPSGVAACLASANFADMQILASVKKRLGSKIFAAFGVHPKFAGEFSAEKFLPFLELADAVGEIGFDKIWLETIHCLYPELAITVCVRGGPTQNDATVEDARIVGMPFPVIGNGNRIPGTQIDQLSEEAKAALDGADVILAKGMANCETMLGCGYNVYYAFLVKCQRFVSRFGKPMMTPMLVAECSQSFS